MGQRKLGRAAAREAFVVSVSTVGRIRASSSHAVPTLRRNPAARRIRLNVRERYARRLPKGHRPATPGELVQIDTLLVNVRPDKPIKHFTAYDPIAKWTIGRGHRADGPRRRTCSTSCAPRAPFPVKGIQVDGGSEFMAEFEQACADKGLTLFVLPPKRPQLNGAVERAQGSWRYEFYACFDLPTSVEAINPILDSFQHLYNHHRPHGALGGKTPAHYLAQRTANETHPSHMS